MFKIILLLVAFLGTSQARAEMIDREPQEEWVLKDARFVGTVQDTGIDQDGDGLYEKLRVTTEIEVVIPGEYKISGMFRLSGDRGQGGAETRKNFGVGKHMVEVDFDSETFRRYRVDGPYDIDLSLPDCFKGDVIRAEDGVTQRHVTGKYNWKQFKGSGAEFTGVYSDRTVDKDGDGKIDALLIDIEVLTAKPGAYDIEGWLTLSHDSQAILNTILPQGKSIVTLEFKTQYEFSSRYEGRYGLKSLQLSQNGVMKDFISDVGPVTRAYSYSEFWNPSVYLDPQSFVEVTKNNWVGGLIQYLEVRYELQPKVKADFPYMINATLQDSKGDKVAEDSSNLVASPSAMSGVLKFSGKEIRKSGKNGPYQLRYITLWSGGDLLDELHDGIKTKSYQYDEFGPND